MKSHRTATDLPEPIAPHVRRAVREWFERPDVDASTGYRVRPHGPDDPAVARR